MSLKKLIIIVLAIFISCNSTKTEKLEKNNDKVFSVSCNENIIFPKSKELKGLADKKGDTVFFSLEYKKDTCYIQDEIKFYRINLALKSESYLSFDFGIGIKNDALYTCVLPDLEYSNIEFIKLFFNLKDDPFPKNVSTVFSIGRNFILDSVYSNINKEKIYRISSYYDMPHSTKLPKYTFEEFHISKLEGFKEIRVKDNETGKLYYSY